MIKVGIVGSSGYVAGELIRCLIHHPEVDLDFLYSHSHAKQPVAHTHQDLMNSINIPYSNTINPDVAVVFLCLGHGNAKAFLTRHNFSSPTKIIDLSSDFRLPANADFDGKTFVYGLAERHKQQIKKATHIANPGCFATAIQLGLLPLAQQNQLQNDVHIHAITGATGAGQSLSSTTHFSWRNNNISMYKAFKHQHLKEIKQSVIALQGNFNHQLNFLPVRGNFTRGIFASMYTESQLPEKELTALYKSFYKNTAFTHVAQHTIHLKQVVNTNNCFIQVQKIDDKVLVTSVIDNLLKGAAGQAIQNMNLMFGFEETTGLQLKASYF